MSDRCEHGARVGFCDEHHPTQNELEEIINDHELRIRELEEWLDNERTHRLMESE